MENEDLVFNEMNARLSPNEDVYVSIDFSSYETGECFGRSIGVAGSKEYLAKYLRALAARLEK